MRQFFRSASSSSSATVSKVLDTHYLIHTLSYFTPSQSKIQRAPTLYLLIQT